MLLSAFSSIPAFWPPSFPAFLIMSLHPEQIRVLKSLSPEAKLKLAESMYTSARKLKESAVRQQHPQWSKEKVNQKVTEIFLYARS